MSEDEYLCVYCGQKITCENLFEKCPKRDGWMHTTVGVKGEKTMLSNVVFIDSDSSLMETWKEVFIMSRISMLEQLGYKVKDVISKKSPSGRGYHIWFHVDKSVDDMEMLRLQFLLGDDVGRVWLNYLRIKRGVEHWNKCFSEILWQKPIDEICERCRLRKIVLEMSKDVT